MPKSKRTILLVGAGRMGQALLKGWLAKGLKSVAVVEPKPSPGLRRLARTGRIARYADIGAVDARSISVCVIATKPQILKSEAARLKPFAAQGALIISIAAGTSIKFLARACGAKARVVRSMPNLPGAVGKGISALFASRRADAKDRKTAENLLSALGETVWVPRESMIDTVTALSGSGPAYVFLLAEALARAGIREGLSPKLAEKLARATIIGSGALLDLDSRTAEQLRAAVTSPHGTTEAALGVFMADDALMKLVDRAVAAARKRAIELRG